MNKSVYLTELNLDPRKFQEKYNRLIIYIDSDSCKSEPLSEQTLDATEFQGQYSKLIIYIKLSSDKIVYWSELNFHLINYKDTKIY